MSTPPPLPPSFPPSPPPEPQFPNEPPHLARPVAAPALVLEYRSPNGDSWGQMLEIARAQKQLLWMVLANIGTGILFMAVTTNWRGAPTSIAILIPAYLILLVSTGLQIFFLVRLMLAMRFHIAAVVLLPILMLISCIGLIVLLVINQTATSRLQRGGIRVGFMGAEIPAGPPMPIGQLPITPRPLPTPPGPPQ